MKKILITSALPYANGPIHLGHLMSTYLPADVYARFCRMKGYDALYVCASDEHGAPIEINAAKAGKTPKDFTAQWHEKHAQDFAAAGVEFDEFYHTHSPEGEEFAKLFFEEHEKKGVIYKKPVMQTYCQKCIRFLPDRYVKGTCPFCKAQDQYGDGCEKCGKVYQTTQLESPKCALCSSTPVQKESEHYFFKLSFFQKFLGEWFEKNKNLPHDVINYLKTWLETGLQDWDITRNGPYFGFNIPNEKDKYFYVWYDAPIGYVSATKHYCQSNAKAWESYWKNSQSQLVHFIGKDIVYHHFLFWPSMLSAAGFSLPTRIPVRGHLTLDGQKMSKSRGTLIMLNDFLEKYPANYLRYYLCAITPQAASDCDFSWKEFQAKTNNELVNSVGNFYHRTFTFIASKYNSTIPQQGQPAGEDEEFKNKTQAAANAVEKELENASIKTALEHAMAFSAECNKYFNDRAPWKLLKDGNKNQADAVICNSARAAYALALMLYPFLPHASREAFKQLGLSSAPVKWNDLAAFKPGLKLEGVKIIFEKIEDEQIALELEALNKAEEKK